MIGDEEGCHRHMDVSKDPDEDPPESLDVRAREVESLAKQQDTIGKDRVANSGGIHLLTLIAALFFGTIIGFIVDRITIISAVQAGARVESEAGEERKVSQTRQPESFFPV
jgi:hypothetical protein